MHLEHLEKANKHEEDTTVPRLSQLMPFPPGKLDPL